MFLCNSTLFFISFLQLLGGSASFSLQQQQQQVSSSSLLTSTPEWKLRLDIGLQPGTWMPKRYPGWAESGGRLVFDLNVKFTDQLYEGENEKLLKGPKIYQVQVTNNNDEESPITFVSERGQEIVDFHNVGGWCIPDNNPNVLRFHLDCRSGAKRRDVEIFPNTRIFFTTGIWDNPDLITKYGKDYDDVCAKLQALKEKSKRLKEEQSNLNIIQNIWSIREMVNDSTESDLYKGLKERYERQLLPPKNGKAVTAPNGVQMASIGSLVIKGNETPWYIPGSEYLIFGSFSTTMPSLKSDQLNL